MDLRQICDLLLHAGCTLRDKDHFLARVCDSDFRLVSPPKNGTHSRAKRGASEIDDECAWPPKNRVNGATLHINLYHGVAHRQEVVEEGAFFPD
jgi:hypothetical protein